MVAGGLIEAAFHFGFLLGALDAALQLGIGADRLSLLPIPDGFLGALRKIVGVAEKSQHIRGILIHAVGHQHVLQGFTILTACQIDLRGQQQGVAVEAVDAQRLLSPAAGLRQAVGARLEDCCKQKGVDGVLPVAAAFSGLARKLCQQPVIDGAIGQDLIHLLGVQRQPDAGGGKIGALALWLDAVGRRRQTTRRGRPVLLDPVDHRLRNRDTPRFAFIVNLVAGLGDGFGDDALSILEENRIGAQSDGEQQQWKRQPQGSPANDRVSTGGVSPSHCTLPMPAQRNASVMPA